MLGADHELSYACLDRAHCLDRIQNQVHDHLLQLNAIAVDANQPFCKAGLQGHSIFRDFTMHQQKYLADRLIEINFVPSWRRFLEVVKHSVNDLPSSISVTNHTGERFPRSAQVWRWLVQKDNGRTGIVARSGDRLRD